jgi:hypothetical protein
VLTAYTKPFEKYSTWENLSAIDIAQQEVNDSEYDDKTEATASPFPAGIAGDRCFEPVLHKLFLIQSLENYASS